MPRLETVWGTKAEDRYSGGIPDNLSCAVCNVAVPKQICNETIVSIDDETLENLKKSGIENLTREFKLHCPKCTSQIFGILLE